MAFATGGGVLAAINSGSGITLWHLPSGYIVDPNLPINDGSRDFASYSTSGDIVAAATSRIVVQRLTSKPTRSQTIVADAEPATPGLSPFRPSVSLGAGGRLLAASATYGTYLWTLADLAHPQQLSSIDVRPQSLALSEDGRILVAITSSQASGTGGGVSLWSVANPASPQQLGTTLTARASANASMGALTADGSVLALLTAVTTGTSVQLWTLAYPATPLPVNQAFAVATAGQQVTALALSPEGKTLAVGTTAGTVTLWNLTTSPPTPYGHPLESNFFTPNDQLRASDPRISVVGVGSLAYSPDGQTLTAVNANRTACTWNLAAAQVAQDICAATGQPLTPAVWQHYVPGTPFQAPCPSGSVPRTATSAAPAPPLTPKPKPLLAVPLCSASDLTLSTGTPGDNTPEPTLALVLTNASHAPCSLTGVPSVSLIGSPDGSLGGTYQLPEKVQPGQAPVTLPPDGKAHVNLTYLVATSNDIPSGGGPPIWIPEEIRISLPGARGTLTAPWRSSVPVLRMDKSTQPGSWTGPFLPGAG
jgi:WD40 repeat protein